MTECIALLRGVNVGRAKRIAMAELRSLFLELGHKDVRTLLNSGNVLFRCTRPNTGKLALAIQSAIADAHGFSASVTVITAADLTAIVSENPLLHLAVDPARHLVAFVAHPRSLVPLRSLMKSRGHRTRSPSARRLPICGVPPAFSTASFLKYSRAAPGKPSPRAIGRPSSNCRRRQIWLRRRRVWRRSVKGRWTPLTGRG